MKIPVTEEAFDYLLQLETKRAVRYGYFLSLLILEVDQESNEEEVLKSIGDLIRGQVRGTDVIGISKVKGKMGRFQVLLTYSEPEQTRIIGERIRSRVEIHTFQLNEQDEIRTLRGGAACFPEHSRDIDGLISTAESMLEKASERGGNRLVIPENPALS